MVAMMTIIEIEAALRAFLDAAKGHDSLSIGPCEICLTQPAAYEALDQLVQHRCGALSPSIEECLNSGGGSYRP